MSLFPVSFRGTRNGAILPGLTNQPDPVPVCLGRPHPWGRNPFTVEGIAGAERPRGHVGGSMAEVAMRRWRATLVAVTAAMLVAGAACGSSDGMGDSTAAGSVQNGPVTIHAGATDPDHPQIA